MEMTARTVPIKVGRDGYCSLAHPMAEPDTRLH